ncbi:MAG: arsenic resistance N-acetyltransferase ArsN2 [Armatimonadota bacterium]|nr:arsenic resistance N-acetyltransferase ArsN2 [Armatimonadota bacterium]MDR7549957.1 arsenic resistance N-acetyltransferase ArsN2 [Armatimonadota bacterium]
MLTITNAGQDDLEAICALLSAVGLSTDGVAEAMAGFLVAREDGRVVAVAGLEDHGAAGVLRSVAVAPDRRNQRLGAELVAALIDRSRQQGHRALYLLTNGAEGYFARFGFRRVGRDAVRPEVARSSQFGSEACTSSAVMVLEFGAGARTQED